MNKKWVTLVLVGVFLFWMAPEFLSNHLSESSTSSQIIVERQFLGFSTGRSVYERNEVQAIAVQYHKAYFDFKMRGIYRIGLLLRDGKFIVLKQINTTLQNEISLAYAPDLQIKYKQALDDSHKIAAQLSLVVQDETL